MQYTAIHGNHTLGYSEKDFGWLDQLGTRYRSVGQVLAGWFPPQPRVPTQTDANRQEPIDRQEPTETDTNRRMHEVAEAAVLGQSPPHQPESDSERALFRAAWDMGTELRNGGGTLLGTGLLVFIPAYAIFGYVDVAYRDGDGVMHICDWALVAPDRVVAKPCRWPLHNHQATTSTKQSVKLAMTERIMRDGEYVQRDGNIPIARHTLWVAEDGATMTGEPDMARETAELLLASLTDIPF